MRAKRWLEATTRVNVYWLNPEFESKLTFSWADGTPFSFDLGGVLRGGQIHAQEFVAEVKNYDEGKDQGQLYPEYLAKCYCAYLQDQKKCDHLMWITWLPFSITKWTRLMSEGEVHAAVLAHRDRALAEADPDRARNVIDPEVCKAVAERLWLIVLSAKQEQLVVEDEDRYRILAGQMQREEERLW